MQTIIRVEKLAKTFNQHQALHAVDLNIHPPAAISSCWAAQSSAKAAWPTISAKAAPTPATSSNNSTW